MPLPGVKCKSSATTPNKFFMLMHVYAHFIDIVQGGQNYWKIYLEELEEDVKEDCHEVVWGSQSEASNDDLKEEQR